MKTRKSWREKLETVQEAKLVPIPLRMQKRLGAGTLLVPRPLDVDSTIRLAQRGQLITQGQIRAHLATQYGADATCPITTGIFVRIAAEAAAEDERAGKQKVTPYWRVIRDDGTLLAKLPGGPEGMAKRLAGEGQSVVAGKGRAAKELQVADFESHLIRL